MRSTKNSIHMNKGRVQSPDGPCNTLGAHLAKASLNSTDPVLKIGRRYRMFTPREVSRLQSFPESFKLATPKSHNYIALGNAVPPVLMWYVAKSVLRAME
jgi:DNA (cytosine-5)-methyltransferase 1